MTVPRTSTRVAPYSPVPNIRVPRHVAVIMDGNGRWAQARQRPRTEGHLTGVSNIRRVLAHFQECGVSFVTVFAFSTENWGRPREEVSFLLALLRDALKTEVDALHANNVRVLHIGKVNTLPAGFREEIRRAVQLTSGNTGLTFSVAFNYGGRDEIVDATRRIVADHVSPEDIDEAVISQYMYCPELPDPDLVIRTGGEFRISNFLLWQTAYSEFYSAPVPWPDFDETEVDRALAAYASRERRFGRVNG